jgi:predicted site-specific integrase-resolvase
MPIIVSSETYLRTLDVCKMVSISRTTLLRWFKEGTFREPERRDRRGWRLTALADALNDSIAAEIIWTVARSNRH